MSLSGEFSREIQKKNVKTGRAPCGLGSYQIRPLNRWVLTGIEGGVVHNRHKLPSNIEIIKGGGVVVEGKN